MHMRRWVHKTTRKDEIAKCHITGNLLVVVDPIEGNQVLSFEKVGHVPRARRPETTFSQRTEVV